MAVWVILALVAQLEQESSRRPDHSRQLWAQPSLQIGGIYKEGRELRLIHHQNRIPLTPFHRETEELNNYLMRSMSVNGKKGDLFNGQQFGPMHKMPRKKMYV